MSKASNQRSLHILQCIVDRYLETGEPVSSGAISEMVNLSSATVRNIMAELEEAELLYSSHVSSGRTPTTSGVNMFINDLGKLNLELYINDTLKEINDTPDSVYGTLEKAVEKVSNVTNSVALAVYPKDDIFVEHVEIRKISNERLLLILVFSDGNVKSVVFRPTEENIAPRVLITATGCLNKIMYGQKLSDLNTVIANTIIISRAQYDLSTALLISDALNSQLFENTDSYFIIKGQVNLFNNAETIIQLHNAKKVINSKNVQKTFFGALEGLRNTKNIGTFIGEDSFNSGYSLVLSPCLSYNGDVIGAVGVMCHSKTNYKKLFPIVSFIAKLLSGL